MIKCDPVTGVCQLPELDNPNETVAPAINSGSTVHYIGDPMCSWCWGISPTISAVEAFCQAKGIGFSITMGGLRPGGGDPWNDAFKDFLRNEWRHITQKTGQPFGFVLLEAKHFNYDTEPACRAVATVKLLQVQHQLPVAIVLKFLAAIQHDFYVAGKDPKTANFYASICTDLELNFDEFRTLFNSPAGHQAVQQDFARSRQLGVRSFPTLLLEHEGKIKPLAVGYTTAEQVISQLQQVLTP